MSNPGQGDAGRPSSDPKSSPKKKSKKGTQGSPLPADGSLLSRYPVGSCVLLEIEGVTDWYLIAFRIGGSGNPHLRRMRHPPTSADWNVGPSYVREFSDRLVVRQADWPLRIADDRTLHADSDPDPVLGGNLRTDDAADQLGGGE